MEIKIKAEVENVAIVRVAIATATCRYAFIIFLIHLCEL